MTTPRERLKTRPTPTTERAVRRLAAAISTVALLRAQAHQNRRRRPFIDAFALPRPAAADA